MHQSRPVKLSAHGAEDSEDPRAEASVRVLFLLTKRLFSAILKEICSGNFKKYAPITSVYQDEKKAPKDEVSRNAELLLRAGFIHKDMAGVYSFLPLGLRTLNRVIQVIREEMNAVGGQDSLASPRQGGKRLIVGIIPRWIYGSKQS